MGRCQYHKVSDAPHTRLGRYPALWSTEQEEKGDALL